MNERERRALADVRAVFLEGVELGEVCERPAWPRRMPRWRPFVEIGLVALALALGARSMVQSRVVAGSSMEPTLRDGERVLVDRIAYLGPREPRRGDVVVFKSWPRRLDPFDHAAVEGDDFIKRVVGVPGDRVEIRSGRVFLNGRVLDDADLVHPPVGDSEALVLAHGEYYVLGDNRSNSSDSRLFGAVSAERIVGRAWLRYRPFEDAGRLVRAHGDRRTAE